MFSGKYGSSESPCIRDPVPSTQGPAAEVCSVPHYRIATAGNGSRKESEKNKVDSKMKIWARHGKTNEMCVRPAKTQVSLGVRPVRSESSLSTWRKLGSLATYWAHREDSDQTRRMPSLIWVFAGCSLTLLVLSCHGSVFVSLICLPSYSLPTRQLLKVRNAEMGTGKREWRPQLLFSLLENTGKYKQHVRSGGVALVCWVLSFVPPVFLMRL